MAEVSTFDAVVVGGGPAGSTLATLVAMRGHRVLILEKETFPRYQIGESLLPSTIHGICRLLGVTDDVAKAGFAVKRGGTFRWGASPEPWTFTFAVSSRMAGPTSTAYQVERSKFDDILLRNARRKGVEVRENCSVTSTIEDSDGRLAGVRYVSDDGAEHEVQAAFVVDASGNRSRIHQQVGGTRQYSEFFRSLALFGYFEGGKRLPAPSQSNILCAAFDSGWFWYIPLSDTLTSVGAVVRRDDAEKIQGDPEKAMRGLIAECPMISDFLSSAQRVTTGQYGQLRVRKDYSYHQSVFWKPGFVLVGDAACFVDPVFSSGVHLATYGALLAARSINSILSGDVEEKTAFQEFESRYRREYGVFYEFLVSFYDMHRDENSYFWQAKKVTGGNRPDVESFVDLIGGVSSGEAAMTSRVHANSEELASAVNQVTVTEGGNMVSLMRAGVVRDAMQGGAQVQMRAFLGEDAEPEVPQVPGGLVAAADGLAWQAARITR